MRRLDPAVPARAPRRLDAPRLHGADDRKAARHRSPPRTALRRPGAETRPSLPSASTPGRFRHQPRLKPMRQSWRDFAARGSRRPSGPRARPTCGTTCASAATIASGSGSRAADARPTAPRPPRRRRGADASPSTTTAQHRRRHRALRAIRERARGPEHLQRIPRGSASLRLCHDEHINHAPASPKPLAVTARCWTAEGAVKSP